MYTGPDLNKSEISQNVPNPLTKRIVMSQLMAVFDSCGLVAPFRRTWQRSEIRGNNTDWDASIPDDLVPKWVHFVKEVTKISEVYFPRCLKIDQCANPVLITFCDGAMVYVRWEGEYEAVKGETVRSEMCGAVFAARLSKFVKENYRYQFTKFYHFIDSMTVLGAINKESYGFSTF